MERCGRFSPAAPRQRAVSGDDGLVIGGWIHAPDHCAIRLGRGIEEKPHSIERRCLMAQGQADQQHCKQHQAAALRRRCHGLGGSSWTVGPVIVVAVVGSASTRER